MSAYDPDDTGADAVSAPLAAAAAEEPFPWPPAEEASVVTAFSRTWQGATLHAREFFARMPEQGSLGAAILYYLAIGITVAGVSLFLSVLNPPDEETVSRLSQLGLGDWNPLIEFLLSPPLLLGALFLWSGVTHLLLVLLGGAHQRFAFTARLMAFSYSPALLGIIPYIGDVAGLFWMIYVAIIALREGHRTTTGKAVAAVLLPVFGFVVAIALLAVIFVTAGFLMLEGLTR